MGHVEWNVGDGYWARLEDGELHVEIYERCDGECDRTLPRRDGRTIRLKGYNSFDIYEDAMWICYACMPERHADNLSKPLSSR